MKIEYFTDTDTLLVEFNTNEIAETKNLNENTLVEFDAQGVLVSMTIEHAKEQTNLDEFIFHPRQMIQSASTPCMIAEEETEYKTK